MRGVVGREEPLLALLLGRVAPAGELDSGALGEDLERFGLRQAVDLLEDRENVPRPSTTETLVAAGIRVDVERRRLLAMEWTEPGEPAAGLLQVNPVLFDDLNDVDALFDGVEIPRHHVKYRAWIVLKLDLQQLLEL